MRFFDSMRDSTNRLFPYKDDLLFGKIVIQENDFDSNEAGQKGSAIYTRQIGNLLITGNTIRNNMPSYSFRVEAADFPYFQYLSSGLRPTLFAPP